MVDHTSLPPELWLDIFKWATYTDEARRVGPPVDAFQRRQFAPSLNWAKATMTPMHVKRVLTLVCRAWHAIAVTLLYEYVEINSTSKALLLLRTVVDSEKRVEEPSYTSTRRLSHAQWIRHLHIHTCTRSSAKIKFSKVVLDILLHCTNLQIFSAILHRPLPEGVPAIITRLAGERLQCLSWRVVGLPEENVFGVGGILAVPMLQGFRNIRVLDLSRLKVTQSPETMDSPDYDPLSHLRDDGECSNERPANRITLPALVKLFVSYNDTTLCYARALELPRLEYLGIDETSPGYSQTSRSTPS